MLTVTYLNVTTSVNSVMSVTDQKHCSNQIYVTDSIGQVFLGCGSTNKHPVI